MARAHFRFTVRDVGGNVVQNALVNVYQTGTTTPVTDLFAAASGGSPITTLTSNAQGEVEGYLTTAKTIDLNITDNADAAYYPSQPAGLLSWTPFTETVEAYNDADDVQTAVSHVSDTAAHATDAELAAHEADTTAIHGIADTSALLTTAHTAAGDPHTGYRLESENHTHATAGAQGGTLDHGTALTGLGDDDHPQYVLESWFKTVRRTADSAAKQNNTLADDDTLLFAVGASEVWFIEAWLLVSAASATMDAKFGWSVPAGATLTWGTNSFPAQAGGWVPVATASAAAALTGTAGTVSVGTLNGTIGVPLFVVAEVGGTAGNIVLQWAQATTEAADLKLLKNSFLRVTRLA